MKEHLKIVLTDNLAADPAVIEENRKKLESLGHTFEAYDRLTNKEIIDKAADADVLMVTNRPLSKEVIEKLPDLKLIDVAFTGVDHIPVKEAKEKGIAVCNASGYATDSTAELAVALMLAKLRDLDKAQKAAREGRTKDGLQARTLNGKTVGIIGTGAIGLKTAKLAKAFGAKTIGYSRTKKDTDAIDEYADLAGLLSQSDIVSIHVPLSEQTRNLINKEAFDLMKENAILINTARGPVVNALDLEEALASGKIGGAALDVFDIEPPLDPYNTLLEAPNLTVTPHIGFYSEESMTRRAQIVFDNLYAWLDGGIQNEVK
jgi:D-3-phosphoglycerate dehydrogenase